RLAGIGVGLPRRTGHAAHHAALNAASAGSGQRGAGRWSRSLVARVVCPGTAGISADDVCAVDCPAFRIVSADFRPLVADHGHGDCWPGAGPSMVSGKPKATALTPSPSA